MKTNLRISTHALALLFLKFTMLPVALFAQGTAFTYQGSLNDGANRASGVYDLQFAIYNAGSGPSLIAGPITNSATAVSNGLFTVKLDFGAGPFNGAPCWLEISVRSNGLVSFATLTPRRQLTPTPYAITASNLTGTLPAAQLTGTLSSGLLSGGYNGVVNFNNAADHFSGDGTGLTGVNAAALGGLGPNAFWQTTGNSNIIAGLNYLGTADSNAFELHVNGVRALRIEPDPTGGSRSPNLIGGYSNNAVLQPDSAGNIIAGGGEPGHTNLILTNCLDDAIAGTANLIGPSTRYAFIGAGQGNVASNTAAVVVGGFGNSNSASLGFIGGGFVNNANAEFSVIVGGYQNEAGGIGSFVGGGGSDGFYFLGNHADGGASAIVGGVGNTIQTGTYYSFIGGGIQNLIQFQSEQSVIVGGYTNVIGTNSGGSIIVGGEENIIGTNGFDTIIVGGLMNTNLANSSVIAGGQGNTISYISGNSFIGGGYNETIGDHSFNSVIVGGGGNSISNASYYSTIGGGFQNGVGGNYSTVPGGFLNAALGQYSFAAGYRAKATNSATFVWADNQGSDFNSTANYQFLIRATGGVGINKNNPATALDVNGTVTASAFSGSFNASQITNGTIPDNVLSGVYTNALFLTNTNNTYAGNGNALFFLNAFNLIGLVPSAALGGNYTNFLFLTNPGNTIAGNGSGLTSVNAALLNGQPSTNFWSTTGNAGTTAGPNYIGTSDNQKLLIRGSFVGINRSNSISGSEFFGIDCNQIGNFGGMYINIAGGAGRPFYGYAENGVAYAYTYVDSTDANKWRLNVNGDRITVTQNGNVGIGNNSPTNLLMVGNARCDGSTWISVSDRNLKEHFTPIDPEQILAKVAALPVTEWNYKNNTTEHLGPVAQDFYAEFNLGTDDKSIATIDESGVALAAIQGLNKKVEAQAAELKERDTRIAALEKAVTELRGLVEKGSRVESRESR